MVVQEQQYTIYQGLMQKIDHKAVPPHEFQGRTETFFKGLPRFFHRQHTVKEIACQI